MSEQNSVFFDIPETEAEASLQKEYSKIMTEEPKPVYKKYNETKELKDIDVGSKYPKGLWDNAESLRVGNKKDPIRITVDEFRKKYGDANTESCLETYPDCYYGNERIASNFKYLRDKMKPFKLKVKNRKFKGRFLGMETEAFTNIEHLRKHPNATKLYFFLRANEITYDKGKSYDELYNKYFLERGLIVVSYTLGQLKEIFNTQSIKVVRNWIDELVDEKSIIKDTVYDINTKQYKPTIFILGYVDDEGYYNYLYGNNENVYTTTREKLESMVLL